jgi:hypothetical protein
MVESNVIGFLVIFGNGLIFAVFTGKNQAVGCLVGNSSNLEAVFLHATEMIGTHQYTLQML